MDHQAALDVILEHLLEAAADPARLQAAQAHIAGCRDCLAQLDASLGLLAGQPADLIAQAQPLLTCDECRERLPEYAEADEAAAASRLPGVARHLPTCAACREELALLREWLATPLAIPAPPTPTFAQRSPAPAESIWTLSAAQVHRLIAAVHIRLEAGGARLGDLAAALRPMQFAPVAVRGRETQSVDGLRLTDEAGGVRIELRLASQSQLAVRLFPLGAAPLAGQGRVILTPDLPGSPPWQRIALPVGSEVALPLQPGHLLVRIEFEARTWEIPLAVVSESPGLPKS